MRCDMEPAGIPLRGRRVRILRDGYGCSQRKPLFLQRLIAVWFVVFSWNKATYMVVRSHRGSFFR